MPRRESPAGDLPDAFGVSKGGREWGEGCGPGSMSEEFVPRPIGWCVGEIVTATNGDRHGARGNLGREGGEERGLADARLARDKHEPPLPAHHGGEEIGEDGPLVVATDQKRLGAG